jgi:hypothetical protein
MSGHQFECEGYDNGAKPERGMALNVNRGRQWMHEPPELELIRV